MLKDVVVNNKKKGEVGFRDTSAKALAKAYRKFQKIKNFGTEYCKNAMRCGKYGIPLLDPYYGALPTSYVSISSPTCDDPAHACMTCFDYDYILERMWYEPDKYVDRLLRYQCFGTLDFSMKVDDPLGAQIGNKYRNHALSFYFQERGARHLPVIGWSSRPSFDFCFQGFSKGGAVMVSTLGVLRDERSQGYFKLGFCEMLKQLNPDVVVIYGDGSRERFSWMPQELEIVFVTPLRLERARTYGR
ncbi:MAG: DUF4417 domain-containing protein [Bacteroidales bacterium]|nr:DUF4417 domain-containing protein [Bacteroidales bacterium]